MLLFSYRAGVLVQKLMPGKSQLDLLVIPGYVELFISSSRKCLINICCSSAFEMAERVDHCWGEKKIFSEIV